MLLGGESLHQMSRSKVALKSLPCAKGGAFEIADRSTGRPLLAMSDSYFRASSSWWWRRFGWWLQWLVWLLVGGWLFVCTDLWLMEIYLCEWSRALPLSLYIQYYTYSAGFTVLPCCFRTIVLYRFVSWFARSSSLYGGFLVPYLFFFWFRIFRFMNTRYIYIYKTINKCRSIVDHTCYYCSTSYYSYCWWKWRKRRVFFFVHDPMKTTFLLYSTSRQAA